MIKEILSILIITKYPDTLHHPLPLRGKVFLGHPIKRDIKSLIPNFILFKVNILNNPYFIS